MFFTAPKILSENHDYLNSKIVFPLWHYHVTDTMDMSLSKPWEIMKDRGAWSAAVHGVTKSWTWLSDWNELYWGNINCKKIYIYSLVAQMGKHLPTMRETWVQSLSWEDPLEKEMATHSITLAWKIPWTEKPGRLLSMASQRFGHDWATSLSYIYLYMYKIGHTKKFFVKKKSV